MGTHQNNGKTTTTKTKAKPRKRLPWETDLTGEGDASWAEVSETLVADTIVAACAGGASVQFTMSRDGGTLGVRVYDEKMPKKTVWARHGGEIEEVLEKIITHFSS